MWNTGNSWQSWANQDLNYRPVRRPKVPYSTPNRLYNNFVPQSGLVPEATSTLSSYEFGSNGDFWRAPLMLETSRPNLLDRVDYWAPRTVAPKVQLSASHQDLWKDFETPSHPLKISFLSWKSAKECGVKWNIPIEPSERTDMLYTLKIYEGEKLHESVNPSPEIEEFIWKSTPGMFYDVELKVRSANGLDVASGKVNIKATFSIAEMEQLLERALSFCGDGRSNVHPFRILYRCKPEYYWQDIVETSNSIMIKYIKDENGQAASPINGAIYGLFFSARLLPSGALPSSSPFGNIRMSLPAEVLLHPDRVNFYFSDFYCNTQTHYVTVVVCVKESKTDQFCRAQLIPLHPNNPFIGVIKSHRGFEFYVSKKVWVEMYYTESIPISWGRFDRIKATGLGTSKIGGLPHNKTCKVCNLYPVESNTTEPLSFTNNPYEYEEMELESEIQLNKMVNSMNSIGLPRENCEDIVFLVGNIIDQVVYEDVSTSMKNGESVFGGKKVPIDEVMKTLDDPELMEGSTKTIVMKIRRLHESLTKKIEAIRLAITMKKEKSLRELR
ncbi:hypothetical protein FO519_001046 [Halicephalobus sp. NKZ332]|nr:hypothetical protein FO519_001046 [Halicephalobus sp. NKZ332]